MPGLVVPAREGGRALGGGFFYLFLHFCFITTGRAGAVVSRAIGPPVGSLHAAQAILLPGSSAVCIVTSGREGRGSRGRGAFGGVLPRYQAWEQKHGVVWFWVM